MKKILAGMFYRLIRGFELWALIALMIFASMVINLSILGGTGFISVIRTDDVISDERLGTEYKFSAADVKQYRFESLGISALDTYRVGVETVPDQAYEILDGTFNFAQNEVNLLFRALDYLYLIPSFLMMIFIPVFFGRMFSDGTIKNIISSGESKGSIFLSSCLLTAVLDIALFIINIATLVFWCMFFEWKPPVYLPVVLPEILLMFLLLLAFSAVSLAVLFASSKKTAAFIAGFLLTAFALIPNAALAAGFLDAMSNYMDPQKKDVEELREIMKTNRMNYLEKEFDISEFNIRYSYKGRELDVYGDLMTAPSVKYTLLAIIYIDPAMVLHIGKAGYIYIPPYMLVRDGLVAINAVTDIIWIVLSAGTGYLVFRKREIHC